MTTEQLLQVLATRVNSDKPPTMDWIKRQLAQAQIAADRAASRAITPEAQALQAKAAEQRQIAANMRAQATADAILQTLPPDPTPDDHDAVAEKLEVAAKSLRKQIQEAPSVLVEKKVETVAPTADPVPEADSPADPSLGEKFVQWLKS